MIELHVPQPTPYQDINVALNLLLSNMQAILGDQLIGLYLGGSLALGDFNPHRSDIDFTAVTADELPPETIIALEEMHTRLWATGTKWVMQLDGSYVPQKVLRRWTAASAPCPFVEADNFYVTHQGSAVIQRHILREHGVMVAGPSPHTLIDAVVAAELRSALQNLLEKWWRPLLVDPAWVAQAQGQPFAVLTMCRTLYTLEYGMVVSKPVAARWAQQTMQGQWAALIEWALAAQDEENHLALTLRLIQYALERYGRFKQGHMAELYPFRITKGERQ